MPELPDVELYCECLRHKILGKQLEKFQIVSMFVLRSVSPQPGALIGKKATAVSRLGKRIVLEFEDGLFLVVHLMVAGRFKWSDKESKKDPITLALWEFEGGGTLKLTEASKKKRAAIYVVSGKEAVEAHDPGGIDPLAPDFPERLSEIAKRENRTMKRMLTNPSWISGIGNAYSDEILHAAKISPIKLSHSLKEEEIARLAKATQDTLNYWSKKLLDEFKGGDKFPGAGDVTAFRPDFAVHGKFGKPCPVCGAPVQRIVHAENETNYCAICQNGGVVLADRALSKLLKSDWPRTLEGYE